MKDPDGFGDRDGWRYTKKINTLEELLCAMTPNHWAVSAELRYFKRYSKEPATLYLSRDCNYYVDTKQYDVPREIAAQAVDRHLVVGVPKWGYTSDHEWQVSDLGRDFAQDTRRRYEDHQQTTKIVPVDCVAADEGEG